MRRLCFVVMALMLFNAVAKSQIGKPFIHDPSTIMECNGKYYTFGTGGGGLVSEDGWNWTGGAVRPHGGAAPDAIKIGNRYLIAYSTTGGGLGGGHASKIMTMWSNSLDPQDPEFGFTDPIEVASSADDEDCDAIDAGLLLDPTDGRLWLTYGTYFGFIRLVELDPKTGERVPGNMPIDIAIDCEATDLIYRNGWYYLLGTHGTCCDGLNSTYNIVVGRSRKVTGPYLDNVGRDMLRGGGKMVIAANGTKVGPGHFGLIDCGDGVTKMSCHFEGDYDRSGMSVLGIRPLLWKNDWPVAGDLFKEGTYMLESERRGYALELAVDFTRLETAPRRWWRDTDKPTSPVAFQKLEDVIGSWPTGNIKVRLSDYMMRPHQKWTIAAMPEAGGYLGGPYFKIVIQGTDKALTATRDREVIVVPQFSGTPEQLWRIDQLPDGTYRIMPKRVPDCAMPLALTSVADSSPALTTFDPNSDNCKWNLKIIE